jgi:two-component system, sporulation sensor kinase A
VRNPLTAVKGLLKLLKEETNHPYLSTMEKELDKALGTLTNLLHVTKLDFHEEPSVVKTWVRPIPVPLLFVEKNLPM